MNRIWRYSRERSSWTVTLYYLFAHNPPACDRIVTEVTRWWAEVSDEEVTGESPLERVLPSRGEVEWGSHEVPCRCEYDLVVDPVFDWQPMQFLEDGICHMIWSVASRLCVWCVPHRRSSSAAASAWLCPRSCCRPSELQNPSAAIRGSIAVAWTLPPTPGPNPEAPEI